jgi:hypothetical protein
MFQFLFYTLISFSSAYGDTGGISFELKKGRVTKRKADKQELLLKFFTEDYTLLFSESETYQPSSNKEEFATVVINQFGLMSSELTKHKLLDKKSTPVDTAILMLKTFHAADQNGQFTERSTLVPLEPHQILYKKLIPEADRKSEDVIDTLSVSLIAVLSIPECKLIQYPNSKSDTGTVFGAWCEGTSSYPKHVFSYNKGSIVAVNSVLLPTEVTKEKINEWSTEEALQLAYSSNPIAPTSPKPTSVEPEAQEKPKPKVSTEIKDDSHNDHLMVIAAIALFLSGAGIGYRNKSKRRRQELIVAKRRKEEEEQF